MRVRAAGLLLSLMAVALLFSVACSKSPRTDAQVASDVQSKIYSDGAVQSRQIGVQANAGIVTLTGTVATDTERAAAANDAAAIEGVKTVVNNLQVQQAQTLPSPAQQALATPPAPEPQKPTARRETKRDRAQASAPVRLRHETDQERTSDNLQASNGATGPMQSQPTAPATPPTPPPPQKVTVPAGTQITVRLSNPLDSERNQVGDTFHGTLGAPVTVDGETVIPTGADVTGRVVNVQSAGRFAGQSLLTLELNSLSINGRTYNLQTNQWSRQGKGEGKNTAVKAGGGAAIGAIIGGLAGGGRGAAIGAAAGGATGTGVAAAKKGEQIKLGPESSLNFQLINSVTVVAQNTTERNAGRTPLPD